MQTLQSRDETPQLTPVRPPCADPSILECSEGDGSAVAVLSYLDALLETVHEGTQLESVLLSFLMGEEDSHDLALRQKAAASRGSATRPVKQRQSSALVLLQNTAAGLRGLREGGGSAYFTSLGRFTLKDLLLSHVHSTSAPTATAALKLLHTLLVSHDRWSLGLLDVVLDESATSFPIALREELQDQDESDDEAPFVYPGAQGDDSSDDEFIYPSNPNTPRMPITSSRATLIPNRPASTPSKLPSLLLGTPTAPTVSVQAHHDGLSALLALVGTIDPAYRHARAVGGGSAELSSTGFDNYLRDAEAAISADHGFRRGLALAPGQGREAVELPPQQRRRSTLFGPERAELSARELAEARTMYRHRLEPDSGLTAVLLDSLAHFFSHSPDLNLQLTAALAALALCPYRSIEGWLLRPTEGSQVAGLAALVGAGRREDDEGDDRSVDCEVGELFKQSPAKPAPPQSSFLAFLTGGGPPSRSSTADDSVLAILSALASSVAHYRAAINGFDQYLAERRQGLFFVENLADALNLDSEAGSAFGEAVTRLAAATPAPPPALPKALPDKLPKSAGFGAFLSPKVTRTLSASVDAFATPPRKTSQLSRSTLADSLDGQLQSGWTGPGPQASPASPFAAHYRQTGAIEVRPVVVSTPSALARSAAARGREEDGDESVLLDDPPSPTKRLSPNPGGRLAAPMPSSSSVSEAESDMGPAAKGARDVPAVTLSVVLDNVIVLEEFIKEVSGLRLSASAGRLLTAHFFVSQLAGIVSVRASLGIDQVVSF